MTAGRYDAYRRAREDLIALSEQALEGTEKDVLVDAAEGLLLARGDADVEELRGQVAIMLSRLVAQGRWSDVAADQLWRQLMECGPDPVAPRASTAAAVA